MRTDGYRLAMPADPAIHTIFRNYEWVNVREGSRRALGKYPTKAAAQADGRSRAMRDKVEHIVHNKDGQIAIRNSYGSDPMPPQG